MSERRGTPGSIAVDDLSPGERIVTIGTFDGVHRGHRRLLEQAVERGAALHLPVAGVTFEPAPAAVLRPDAFQGRISTPGEKLEQLAEAGLDEVVVVPFTLELSRRSPEEFMAARRAALGASPTVSSLTGRRASGPPTGVVKESFMPRFCRASTINGPPSSRGS